MNKRLLLLPILLFTMSILTGCLYPDDLKAANQVPAKDQLDSVQRAIDEFKKDTGVLPIKNRDMDTDIYIKYIIDFEKLVPKYISAPPGNSYEKGGIFQYVIWDPENNPTVKLVDLRTPDVIMDINSRIAVKGYPQYGKQLSDFVFEINYKNLGFKEPLTVDSPYTNNKLPIVLTSDGKVIVDYSIDLNILLQEKNIKATPGEDIRQYFAQYYPVLPAYSVPYTVNENNEPVFMYNPLEK